MLEEPKMFFPYILQDYFMTRAKYLQKHLLIAKEILLNQHIIINITVVQHMTACSSITPQITCMWQRLFAGICSYIL